MPLAALGHMNQRTSAAEESDNMIIFVGVNELLIPVLKRGRLCLCLVCTVWGTGVEQGPLFGEAESREMTCCQSELTVTAQCFGTS